MWPPPDNTTSSSNPLLKAMAGRDFHRTFSTELLLFFVLSW